MGERHPTCWWSIRPADPSVKELVRGPPRQAGDLQYALAASSASSISAGELFKLTAKVDLLHVPFCGAGPAMIDVVGCHTK